MLMTGNIPHSRPMIYHAVLAVRAFLIALFLFALCFAKARHPCLVFWRSEIAIAREIAIV